MKKIIFSMQHLSFSVFLRICIIFRTMWKCLKDKERIEKKLLNWNSFFFVVLHWDSPSWETLFLARSYFSGTYTAAPMLQIIGRYENILRYIFYNKLYIDIYLYLGERNTINFQMDDRYYGCLWSRTETVPRQLIIYINNLRRV